MYSNVTLLIPAKGKTDIALAEQLEVEARPHVASVIVLMNLQYGEAIKTGMEFVTTPLVATMDADGQHEVADVLRVLQEQRATGADLVIGARAGVWDPRGLASQLLNAAASILTGQRVRDFGSGCRVFTASGYRQQRLPDGFDHNASLTLGFLVDGRDIRWVTIPRRKRVAGKSHVKLMDGWRTLKTLIEESHGHE